MYFEAIAFNILLWENLRIEIITSSNIFKLQIVIDLVQIEISSLLVVEFL